MSIRNKILTAVLGLSLVVAMAPGIASAALTSAQVSTIIALLQSFGVDNATIANVQASLTGTSTTTTTTSGGTAAIPAGFQFVVPPVLQVGSVGVNMTYLKVILTSQGCFTASVSNTGFGPLTQAGVKCFQAKYGINQVGAVGPITAAKLNSLIAGATTTTTTTTTTTSATSAVSAALASDTPASMAMVDNQATADLLHVNFTGSGTVTSVTLQRSGISDQNTLQNVYLFDGNTRLTDGYSFNVSGQIVMNGLSIAVAGSHEISVRADVASGAHNTSSTIAVALVSFTAGSATSANVMGNTMSIVTGNLATASVGTNSTSPATVNAGTMGYTFWSAPVQINTRAVVLKMANFRMIGSAPSDALSNIKMYIDGVDSGKTATVVAINGANYASFDFTSSPLSLGTGSHTVEMRGDIQKGTNRNITVSVQQASDLTIFDPQVGVNIAVSGTPNGNATINISTGSATVVISPAFTALTNIPGGSTNATIGKFVVHAYGEDVKIMSLQVNPGLGSLAYTTTNSANTTGSQTLTVASSNGFVAGNNVSITSSTSPVVGTVTSIPDTTHMVVNFTTAPGASATLFVTNNGLNNITLYFNGSQIGSQVNWNGSTALSAFQLGSQAIAPAGQDSTLEVRADLQGSTNVAYGAGLVTVTLPGQSGNAQGQSSLNSLTPGVPSATIATNGLTLQTGMLAVSQNSNYASAQNAGPNTSGVRIGSYVIQNQSTSEAIRLTSLKVSQVGTTLMSNISGLRTSDTTGSGSTPIQPSGATTGTTSTDVFSVADTLQPGSSMVVDIFANTSTSTGVNIATTLQVSSIGSVDNISATSPVITGQVVSIGTGAIGTPSLVVSSTTAQQYIASASGASNAAQATFNFVSTGGASTITELKFTVTGSDATPGQPYSSSVTNVCVTPPQGGNPVCSNPVAAGGVGPATADLNLPAGSQLAVPNGGSGLTQNVLLSYSPIGTNGLASPVTTIASLAYVKYTSGGQTITLCTAALGCTGAPGSNTVVLGSAIPAPTLILVGSKPSVTVASPVNNTGLNIADNVVNQIGQVTVTADPQGSIKVRQIKFNVSFSGYSTPPGAIVGAVLKNGTSVINGVTCTPSTTVSITCTFAGGYTGSDYAIQYGASQTFSLYAGTTGAANIGSNKASISTSVDQTNFQWDDTSMNGAAPSVGLPGTNVYNWPTNSYTITQ